MVMDQSETGGQGLGVSGPELPAGWPGERYARVYGNSGEADNGR